MKGLLYRLLMVACLVGGSVARNCNNVDCNTGCCLAQEKNLTLVITRPNHLLANNPISPGTLKFSCALVENKQDLPKCDTCFTGAHHCKPNCKLNKTTLTTCYQGNHPYTYDRQVLRLEITYSCCHGGLSGCRSILQCLARVCAGDMESLNEMIQLPACETVHGTPTPTHRSNIDQTESILIHGKTHQQPNMTLSRSPTKMTPKSTKMRTDMEEQLGSSSLTIIVSVFGCLIVLILAAMLVLLMIFIFRKRKHRQYRSENVLVNSQRPSLPGESSHYECSIMNESRAQTIPLEPSPYETITATTGVYSVLEPPDETQDSDQPCRGTSTLLNHYATAAEQHIYEDADKYIISSQPPADGDDYAKPDDALFDERKHQIPPKTIKLAGGKGCGKQRITQYQPPDNNDDYSIPSDAILEDKVKQPQIQESDGGTLDPLYHELEMNEQQMQTKDDSSSIGVTKGRPAAIESTWPTVSAPTPATAASNLEPDGNNTSHVDTENTSLNWGDQDNSSDPDQTT